MKSKILNSIHFYLRQNILLNYFIFLWATTAYNPLLTQEKITANFLYQKADSIASTFTSNLIIQRINNEDVDTSGKALYWNYIFRQDLMSLTPLIRICLGMDTVSCDTSQLPPVGYAIMDHGWIDSDSALAIAEKNGGREFRMRFEEVKINAALAKESASPYTTWNIWYESTSEKKVFFIAIHGLTGNVLYCWDTSVHSKKNGYCYEMLQNYPNPFNGSTSIHFGINKPGPVLLRVFDMTGRLVDVLLESFYDVGNYEIHWSPKRLPSGVYLCKLETRGVILTKKLLYSK